MKEVGRQGSLLLDILGHFTDIVVVAAPCIQRELGLHYSECPGAPLAAKLVVHLNCFPNEILSFNFYCGGDCRPTINLFFYLPKK